MKDLTVKQLAAISGVTVRTLHHYDEIGLLKPAHVGENGYRYYGRAQLLRLQQILFNLLSNAVGFSPAGETVTLVAERRADAVVFIVTDHGPGIAAGAKDRVFEWFETDSRGSEHRGPGLGLSLVRSFVELHGGTVSIDSAPGHGTTVTCVFPVQHTAKRTAA